MGSRAQGRNIRSLFDFSQRFSGKIDKDDFNKLPTTNPEYGGNVYGGITVYLLVVAKWEYRQRSVISWYYLWSGAWRARNRHQIRTSLNYFTFASLLLSTSGCCGLPFAYNSEASKTRDMDLVMLELFSYVRW